MVASSAAVVVVVLLLAVVAGLLLAYASGTTRRRYRRLVTAGLAEAAQPPARSARTALPDPVARYLDLTGALGAPAVRSFRASFTGRMRRGPDQPWFAIQAEQYDFFDPLTRLFYIRGRIFGVPVIGLDSYRAQAGSMDMRALGIVRVASGAGAEMASSALVTLFNDMCMLAPATLLDSRIDWTPVDTLTARATLRDGPLQIAATLSFNPDGELVNFATHDRFMGADRKYERLPWSTPLSDYKDFGGTRIASQGAASWHMGDEEFVYAEFVLDSLTYNPTAFH